MSEREDPPILNAPNAVKWIAGGTMLAHVGRIFLPEELGYSLLFHIAFIPARYGVQPDGVLEFLTLVTSPVTYMLVHGDLMHLMVNMLLFLAFGAAIARRMGEWPFIWLYVLTGVLGAAVFALFQPADIVPLVGGSGGVAGTVGAVCRLSLRPLDPATPLPFQSRSTAMGFIAIWFVLNMVFGMLPPELLGVEAAGIAWEAHLGGFIAGFILISVFDGRGRPPESFDFPPPSYT